LQEDVSNTTFEFYTVGCVCARALETGGTRLGTPFLMGMVRVFLLIIVLFLVA
jgi:hypothetical protein